MSLCVCIYIYVYTTYILCIYKCAYACRASKHIYICIYKRESHDHSSAGSADSACSAATAVTSSVGRSCMRAKSACTLAVDTARSSKSRGVGRNGGGGEGGANGQEVGSSESLSYSSSRLTQRQQFPSQHALQVKEEDADDDAASSAAHASPLNSRRRKTRMVCVSVCVCVLCVCVCVREREKEREKEKESVCVFVCECVCNNLMQSRQKVVATPSVDSRPNNSSPIFYLAVHCCYILHVFHYCYFPCGIFHIGVQP